MTSGMLLCAWARKLGCGASRRSGRQRIYSLLGCSIPVCLGQSSPTIKQIIINFKLKYIFKMTGSVILYFLIFLMLYGAHGERDIDVILTQAGAQLTDWLGFPVSILESAKQCDLEEIESQLMDLHGKLVGKGSDFTREHIEVIRSELKLTPKIKEFLKCLVEKRNTQNLFFKEKKKYKYLAQFAREHPRFCVETFGSPSDKAFDKGFRVGRFLRAFFEYYYQYVLHPAETVSTKLIRLITTKVDIFDHEDITPCIDLGTSGQISENLENLSINNIYINIPEAFNALKYLKLKEKCRSDKYVNMVAKLTERLSQVDMFKVMYNDYTPYVEIAAEKYGNYQIEVLGEIFASIIRDPTKYIKLSQEEF